MHSADRSSEICLTPACVKSAARILENMNTSVRPCDNFYNFMCGKYVAEKIIPPEGRRTYFGDATNQNYYKIK